MGPSDLVVRPNPRPTNHRLSPPLWSQASEIEGDLYTIRVGFGDHIGAADHVKVLQLEV